MERYPINDTVFYGSEGVCRIVDIVKRRFQGQTEEYYVLQPVYNENSTIYVPIRNEALIGKMRRILSKEEIMNIIQSLPDAQAVWYENENERRDRYRDILARGNRMEIIQMIKALYLRQKELHTKGKRLRTNDEHCFKQAEKILYDEIAHVLNIEPDQVLAFILEQIPEEEPTA